MIVKCPKCGQQLRGEPGTQGKCPKCQTQLIFPQGDRRYGEPIKCPHCGQMQVYKNGKCISCGKSLLGKEENIEKGPRSKKSKPIKRVVALLVVLLLCGAALAGILANRDRRISAGMTSLDDDSTENWSGSHDYSGDDYSGGSSVSDNVPDDYKLAMYMLAQEEVKAQLKSPSTAEFAPYYTSPDIVYSRDGDTYGMISWVEAQNDFGATVRENFTLFATISGGKISNVTCIIGIPA